MRSTLLLAGVLLAATATGFAGSADNPAAVPGAGGRIVFATDSLEKPQGYVIATVQPGTGVGQTWLVKNEVRLGINPKWSRWGSRIAFVRGSEGKRDLYSMNADGSGVTRLTKDPREDINPTWSPDDEWIAFATNRNGNWEIYKMRVDGPGDAVNLTKSSARPDEDPAWSTDGSRIAFQSGGQIRVMRADGSAVRTLASAGVNVSPAWSPDGRQIAFATNRDGNWEVYVMSADGTGEKNLTRGAQVAGSNEDKLATDLDPAWSPDGRYISFTSNRSGVTAIHVMGREGGTAERMTELDRLSTTSDWKSEPTNFAQLRRHVKSGVLRIQVDGGCYRFGTGFIVGANLVVTADHVLDAATRVSLWRAKRMLGTATIVGRDARSDVALLRTRERISGYRFTFAVRKTEEDEDVAALGYFPGTTNVSKVEGQIQPRARRLPFDEGVPPGFSGGPLVRGANAEYGDVGAVLGLVVETSKEGEQTRAVPAALVREKVEQWKGRRKPVPPSAC